MDVGELRLRHDPRRHRLLVLGERLGIVDLDQHRSGGDVLTALDGDFCNAPVDAGCNVEPGRVDLALHQQRLGPHQIPDRQRRDRSRRPGCLRRNHGAELSQSLPATGRIFPRGSTFTDFSRSRKKVGSREARDCALMLVNIQPRKCTLFMRRLPRHKT